MTPSRLVSAAALGFVFTVLAACDVFLPARGGEGQPCLEVNGGAPVCRQPLVCCDGKCATACPDGGLDGGDGDGGDPVPDAGDLEPDGDDAGVDAGDDAGIDDDDGDDDGGDDGSDDGGDDGGDDGDDDQGGDDFIPPDDGEPPNEEEIYPCASDDECNDYAGETIEFCESGNCRYFLLEAHAEVCGDGLDNDGNGFTDLDDSSCGGSNGMSCPDDDADGYQRNDCGGNDCDDTAGSGLAINPGAIEWGAACSENPARDNDCDGAVDSVDSSCNIDLLNTQSFNDIWVINGSRTWAVGDGFVARWNGNFWSFEDAPSGASNSLTAVWAYPAFDQYDLVLVADDTGQLFEKRGTAAWQQLDLPDDSRVNDIWGAHPDEIHLVGARDITSNLRPMWLVLRQDGSLEQRFLFLDAPGFTLTHVSGRALTLAVAVAHKNLGNEVMLLRLVRADGQVLETSGGILDTQDNPVNFIPYSLWVDDTERVWVGGFKVALPNPYLLVVDRDNHFEDVSPAGQSFAISSIFGIRVGNTLNVWLSASNCQILFSDDGGGTWTQQFSDAQNYDVLFLGGSHWHDIWAVGKSGLVLHRDTSTGSADWRSHP